MVHPVLIRAIIKFLRDEETQYSFWDLIKLSVSFFIALSLLGKIWECMA